MVLRLINLFAISLVACYVMSGCRLYSNEFKEFHRLPRDQQIAKFRSFPVEKQINYHLLYMSLEPADSSLSKEIAKQGKSVLPALLDRMKGPIDDYKSVNLLVVFYDMHKKYLDLSSNFEVLRVLEEAYAKIQHPTWKALFRKELDEIRSERPGAGKVSE